jgi:hypothetical protein
MAEAQQMVANLEGTRNRNTAEQNSFQKLGGITPEAFNSETSRDLGSKEAKSRGVLGGLQLASALGGVTDPNTGIVNRDRLDEILGALKSTGVDTSPIEALFKAKLAAQEQRKNALLKNASPTTSTPSAPNAAYTNAMKLSIGPGVDFLPGTPEAAIQQNMSNPRIGPANQALPPEPLPANFPSENPLDTILRTGVGIDGQPLFNQGDSALYDKLIQAAISQGQL